jgi:sugar lactone lactonase YvrE
MYLIDTLASGLDVFDFEAARGLITNRRRLITFALDEGFPDGMTVDREGFLWVAVYGAGVVRRYSAGGELALEIELPVSQPTSCTFGGADLGDLYITSASQHLPESDLVDEPLAGGLFRCRPGPLGLQATAFRG